MVTLCLVSGKRRPAHAIDAAGRLTKGDLTPMADENPMGSGRAVPINVPADHREFLRRTLDACCEGIFGDLAMASAAPLRDPERSWREARGYERLRVALDSGVCVLPDPDMTDALADLACRVDEANEWRRVLAEHRALHRLRLQLDPAGGGR
jgi:hypothetical protein